MEDVLIPRVLLDKLDSATGAQVLRLSAAVAEILSDNKLPFFPNYTDHGVKHVSRLLRTITNHLIPKDILEQFTAADATVLACAGLLHDLAMHLREDGFLQLITGKARNKPIGWFHIGSPQRAPDLPWPEEWIEFRNQIKRFSDHDFFLVLGRLPAPEDLKYWLEEDLPNDPALWSQIDFLIIGEFLRRHHGRLAHEIAIYGFPALKEEVFPILESSLPKLSDLTGLVARSHSLPLREAAAYLTYKYPKDLRPRDATPLYHMALLRIGDYLQIDSERAPAILFKMRAPTVPASVDAWNQHGAVAHISYTLDDPVAIKIELTSDHSLITHLQLEYLINDLQREIDISSAVLSESYGRIAEGGMSQFRLAKLRVYSNHGDRSLLDQLPYIPERIGFGADPKILSLMVEPIYGQFPEFGVRELLQNAVDAVLERRQYYINRKLPNEPTDVEILVDLLEQDELVITITDSGIGMTPEIVRDYFLRAGASFRDSRRWKQEFTDEDGHSQIRRSGRFGVGVFAGFLLGEKMEVTTRHVTSELGLCFVATNGSELIELKKANVPIGTSISIRLSERISSDFVKIIWPRCATWYALADPKIEFRHRTRESTDILRQTLSIASLAVNGELPDWNVFRPSGFACVTWTSNLSFPASLNRKADDDDDDDEVKTSDETPLVYCNGFLVGAPTREDQEERFSWRRSKKSKLINPSRYAWSDRCPFNPPSLLVSDNEGSLPLTLRRDQFGGRLPFEAALVDDIVFDLLAWCLASAPRGPIWEPEFTDAYGAMYPLVRKRAAVASTFCWICSTAGAAPLDRSLLRRLDITGLLGAGTISTGKKEIHTWRDDDKYRSEVTLKIKGGWPVRRPKDFDGVLAFHTGTSERKTTIYKDSDAISHQELQDAMTEALVESLGTARVNREIDVRGAEILKIGPGGSADEVRAGQYVEARTKLSDLIDSTPKSTTYFAWGDERSSDTLETKFVVEIGVLPTDGDSALAKAWSSILGTNFIPFDTAAREKLIHKASQFRNIGDRFLKWVNYNKSNVNIGHPANQK
jgi:hypothetical protein